MVEGRSCSIHIIALSITHSDEGRLLLKRIPDEKAAEENTSIQTESIPRTIIEVRQDGTMLGSLIAPITTYRAEIVVLECFMDAFALRIES